MLKAFNRVYSIFKKSVGKGEKMVVSVISIRNKLALKLDDSFIFRWILRRWMPLKAVDGIIPRLFELCW